MPPCIWPRRVTNEWLYCVLAAGIGCAGKAVLLTCTKLMSCYLYRGNKLYADSRGYDYKTGKPSRTKHLPKKYTVSYSIANYHWL